MFLSNISSNVSMQVFLETVDVFCGLWLETEAFSIGDFLGLVPMFLVAALRSQRWSSILILAITVSRSVI